MDVRVGQNEDDVWRMRVIELPNGVKVIPYLVHPGDAANEDANRGNRGFNGRLRDWIGANADGEVRVLVTYDGAPIETEKTAMDSSVAELP